MPGIIKNLCIGLFLIGTSCTYDNFEELYGEKKCQPEGSSFDQTIKPTLESNCAVNGCHITGQQLPTLESYAQIESNAEKIKARTSNGTMPPSSSGLSLTQPEIDAIACWVDEGAPNN